MFTGLPVNTVEKNIRFIINLPHDSSRNIELKKFSYDINNKLVSITVMFLLSQAKPIEWGQANIKLKGKRAKAVARFYEELNIKKAARSLYDKPLLFYKNIKLII